MAADVSVDQLRISIETKADAAKKGIKSLAADVSKLRAQSAGAAPSLDSLAGSLDALESVSSGLSSFSGVVSDLSRLNGLKISSTIGKNLGTIADAVPRIGDSSRLSELASSVSVLNGKKISSSIGNQLKNISSGLETIDATPFDSQKLNGIASGLTRIANVPKSNVSSTVNALKKLPELAKQLDAMDISRFRSQCEAIGSALGKLPERLSKVTSGIRSINAASKSADISKPIEDASNKTFTLLKRLSSLSGAITSFNVVRNAMNAVANAFIGCIDASNKYIENINLADTSLGQYADRAHEYADAIQSALGINAGEFLSNQGTFMTMAKGMGVASDNAYTMSKGLTQLSYDLASFFNISNDEAFEKVKSGLAGEIEPLRALGYDLTAARLQQEAYLMGIEKNVSDMTQAEKAMLRYKAIMSQVSWAQGDLAKTAASPSNQIRILKSELQTAAQSIGNAFLPALQAIVPIAVAVVKVVATLANLLAKVTGGTAIANMSFGDGGELEGVAGAADDAAGSLDDAGDAASGTGNKAGKAAKQVEELKRQLLGFDEINKFSDTSSSSGSGGSGSGGGGGAGGAGSPSISDIKLDDYDWNLGSGFGDDIYKEIMSLLERIGKAFAPLVNDFKVLAVAIRRQFEGLDIAGAIKNSLAAAANLISNFVRNVIEILGPMAVAFNFPETIALSFDLAAQMCLTLSAAINAVGSMVKGFTDTALVQLVAWVGDKVRGAIYACIEVLQSWQEWFIRNTGALSELGQAAGTGAMLVLRLAEAVADVAFTVAAGAFRALNAVAQVLLETFVNSGAARTAVTLLGAALTAIAISNGISRGLQVIGTVFENMAKKIADKSAQSSDKVRILSSDLSGNLTTGATKCKEGISKLASALGIAKPKISAVGDASRIASSDIADAADNLKAERTALNNARTALSEHAGWTEKLGVKTAEMRVKAAESNLELQKSREKLAAATESSQAYASMQGKAVAVSKELAAAQMQAGNEVGVNTAKTVAATTAAGAMTVAETALTAAKSLAITVQTGLNAVVNAFPGMIFATVLGIILDAVMNLISPLGDFIKGLFGLDSATGDVTDSTNEANQVLSEEEQQVKDNVDSIREYERSHDNLKDALAMAGFSEKQFAQHLADTGQSFDDLKQAQESYTTDTINSFNRLDESQSMTFDQLAQNLQSNLDTQRNWSANMQALMQQTGLGANDALIQGLLSAGPEKVGLAVQEALNDPTGAKLDELKQLAAQLGTDLDPAVANAISATGGAQTKESAGNLGKGATDGIKGESENTKSAAKKTSEDTAKEFESAKGTARTSGTNMVSSFAKGINDGRTTAISNAKSCMQSVIDALNGGTGYNKALSAGKNLIGGYGDGVRSGTAPVVTIARNAMTQVVSALNGGTGYNKALSAGQNLMGGYKDGLSNAVGSAVSTAQSACNRVVNALRSGTGSASGSGSSLMNSFRNGLSGASGSAVSVASSTSARAASAFRNSTGAATSAGRSLGNAFVNGIGAANGSNAGSRLASSAVNGMGNRYWDGYNVGYNLGRGFNNGMCDMEGQIYSNARIIASNAASIMRSYLRIHSPSRVTMEIGGYFGEGFAVGIADTAKDVSDTARDLAAQSLDATSEAEYFGRRVGKAYVSAMGTELGASKVAGMVQFTENAARSVTSSYSSGGASASSPHEWGAGERETGAAAEELGRVLVQTALAVGGSGAQQSGGDTTVVLRVGNEDLARAVMKGNDSLARRGVISLE